MPAGPSRPHTASSSITPAPSILTILSPSHCLQELSGKKVKSLKWDLEPGEVQGLDRHKKGPFLAFISYQLLAKSFSLPICKVTRIILVSLPRVF